MRMSGICGGCVYWVHYSYKYPGTELMSKGVSICNWELRVFTNMRNAHFSKVE